MVSTRHGRAHPFRVLLAIVTALFVVGLTSPSSAATGSGNGSAKAEESAAAGEAAEPAAEKAPAKKVPPGQAKKPAPEPPAEAGGGKPADQDLTQPQPESKGDQNDGGANAGDCDTDAGHAYCSTRDGSPSLNGNGGGAAKGKPCAGCVGKADNKNPPGQAPDGTDANAGYECDRNNGVGKSNPAHTGCAPTEPPGEEPPGEEPPGEEPPGEEPPGEEPPGEEPPGEEPPTDEPPAGEEDETCPDGSAMPDDGDCDEVAGVTGERPRPSVILGPSGGILPNTGVGPLMTVLGLGGAALVLTGAGLILVRRRPELD